MDILDLRDFALSLPDSVECLNRYLPQNKVLEFIRTSHSLIKK